MTTSPSRRRAMVDILTRTCELATASRGDVGSRDIDGDAQPAQVLPRVDGRREQKRSSLKLGYRVPEVDAHPAIARVQVDAIDKSERLVRADRAVVGSLRDRTRERPNLLDLTLQRLDRGHDLLEFHAHAMRVMGDLQVRPDEAADKKQGPHAEQKREQDVGRSSFQQATGRGFRRPVVLLGTPNQASHPVVIERVGASRGDNTGNQPYAERGARPPGETGITDAEIESREGERPGHRQQRAGAPEAPKLAIESPYRRQSERGPMPARCAAASAFVLDEARSVIIGIGADCDAE